VTAEFAAAIPAVLLVLSCCLGAVQVVGQQVRLTDAVADGARSLARGDPEGVAFRRVSHSIGAATIGQERSGDFVCVTLQQAAAFPPAAGLGLTLSARSCALAGGL
jgi:Flp pilus assembly protein TadG